MQILVTNNDGIDSPGLAAMARAASRRGHDVYVAVPVHTNDSGGSGLGSNLYSRVVVQQEERPAGIPESIRCLVVEATAAQIVALAVRGRFGPVPDMVVSGINQGANTGRSILYSGTVSAALAASVSDIRSMAVSLEGSDPHHWDTAEAVTLRIMQWLEFQQLDGRVLNVNIPDVPLDELRGLRPAPLATYGVVQSAGLSFTTSVQMSGASSIDCAPGTTCYEPGTDDYLLRRNWATATMLRPLMDEFAGIELPSLDKLAPSVAAHLHHNRTSSWADA